MTRLLTDCSAFQELTSYFDKRFIPESPASTTLSDSVISSGPLTFLYGTSFCDQTTITLLQSLSDELDLINQYQELLNGKPVNVSEKRSVLHHKTRSLSRGFYGEQQENANRFSGQLRKGQIRGRSGDPIKRIVQIGIGGSELGPHAIYHALSYISDPEIDARFLTNIDPCEQEGLFSILSPNETLFVVASKSGNTLETTSNETFIRTKLRSLGWSEEDIKHHFISVTTPESPMDKPELYRDCFYIDDCIGGRFSCTSVMCGLLISCCFGESVFSEFLEGCYAMDVHAKTPRITSNMVLLSALLNIWYRNIWKTSAKAVIPYSTPLKKIPAHLQQLDCESNGKRVSRNGQVLPYKTSPVLFGVSGTNCQHSFFQMIHQGTDCIPVEFIGVKQSSTEGSNDHCALLANLIAQSIALAEGHPGEDINKEFPGKRPSTILLLDQLSPKSLGSLLSFYENQIMFQGFCWCINSFDQEGVQLGKTLTNDLLSGNGSANLQRYKELVM